MRVSFSAEVSIVALEDGSLVCAIADGPEGDRLVTAAACVGDT